MSDGISEVRRATPLNRKDPPTLKQMLEAPGSTIFEVRLGQATFVKEHGNLYYSKGDFDTAEKLYERGLFYAEFDEAQMNFELNDEHKQQIKETTFPIYMNLSRCHYQQKKWKVSLQDAQRADALNLQDPQKRAKVAFLLGKAHHALGDHEAAIEQLELALSLPCEDKAAATIRPLLQKAKTALKRDKQSEKRTWSGRLKDAQLYSDVVSKKSSDRTYWLIAIGVGLVVAITSALLYGYVYL